MSFPNLYCKRTAATAKACYICYKPTTTVLATIDTTDFLYTCPIHLTDRGFATRVLDPEPEPKKPSASPEEIARVKKEWEEKQRQKKDKGKDGAHAADGDEKNGADGTHTDVDGKKGEDGTKADGKQEPANTVLIPKQLEQSTSAKPSTHERYILHRDIFALRVADRRRRRQTTQAKDLAPRLPGVPSSSLV